MEEQSGEGGSSGMWGEAGQGQSQGQFDGGTTPAYWPSQTVSSPSVSSNIHPQQGQGQLGQESNDSGQEGQWSNVLQHGTGDQILIPASQSQEGRLTFYANDEVELPSKFDTPPAASIDEAARNEAFIASRNQMEMRNRGANNAFPEQGPNPGDFQFQLLQGHQGQSGLPQVRTTFPYYNCSSSYYLGEEDCMRHHPQVPGSRVQFRTQGPLPPPELEQHHYYPAPPTPQNQWYSIPPSAPMDLVITRGLPPSINKSVGPVHIPPHFKPSSPLSPPRFAMYEQARGSAAIDFGHVRLPSSYTPVSPRKASPFVLGSFPPRSSVIQVNPDHPSPAMARFLLIRNQVPAGRGAICPPTPRLPPLISPMTDCSALPKQGNSKGLKKQDKKSISKGFAAAAVNAQLFSSSSSTFDPTTPPNRSQFPPECSGGGDVTQNPLPLHLPSFSKTFPVGLPQAQPRPITEMIALLSSQSSLSSISSTQPFEKKKRATRGKGKGKKQMQQNSESTVVEGEPTPIKHKKVAGGRGSRQKQPKVQVVNLDVNSTSATDIIGKRLDQVQLEESLQSLPEKMEESMPCYDPHQPVQDTTATESCRTISVTDTPPNLQKTLITGCIEDPFSATATATLEEVAIQGLHLLSNQNFPSMSKAELLAASELNPTQLGICSSTILTQKKDESSSLPSVMLTELSSVQNLNNPKLSANSQSHPSPKASSVPSSSPTCSSSVSILVKKRGRGSASSMNKNKKPRPKKGGDRSKSKVGVDKKDIKEESSLSPVPSAVDGKTPQQVQQEAKKWFPSPQEQKELYANGCFVIDAANNVLRLQPMDVKLYRIGNAAPQEDQKTVILQIYEPIDLSGRVFHRATGAMLVVDAKEKTLFHRYHPVYCLKIIDTVNVSVFHLIHVDHVTSHLLAIRETAHLFTNFRTMTDLIFRQVIYGDDYIKKRIELGSPKLDSVYKSSWDSHQKETNDRVTELLEIARLPEGFIKPFCFYPNLRFIRFDKVQLRENKIPCFTCIKRTKKMAVFKTSFKRERYDPLTFQAEQDLQVHKPDGDSVGKNLKDKEYLLCQACKNLIHLMWRLMHHRWYIYATIRGYVADLVMELDPDEKLDPDETIDSLLKDYEWLGKSFLEYQVLLAEADKEIAYIKTENKRRPSRSVGNGKVAD